MKLRRIWAMNLRHLYVFRHSLDRLTDAFYWPSIDLLLWGLTSTYFQSTTPLGSNFLVMVVTGILFWIIIWRAQFEITVNSLEELWNKNLINLFGTPLKFSEWITSMIMLGIVKGGVSFGFASLLAYALYQVEIFFYGWYLLPFALILIMNGWWTGFLVSGLILRYGSRVQSFAWTIVMVLAPFAAIYYPVSILPGWAQVIASAIPITYVFEGAREVLFSGSLDWNKVWIGLGLNVFYLVIATVFLRSSFRRVLQKGLVKVY